MKFLFDENLSPRLVGTVATQWPDCAHVEDVGLRGASDENIWAYAHDHGFTILSKDEDFLSLALVRGAPPQVVWLQIGNASTAEIARLLLANAQELTNFAARLDEALLCLKT